MSLRLDGTNPLSHIGVTPESVSADYTFRRDPTPKDYQGFNLMTRWLNEVNQVLWVLVNKYSNVATWQRMSGSLRVLTSNTGGPVPPDNAGNINVVGDGVTITGVGNPGTNTITFSVIGGQGTDIFQTDSGTAAPIAGVINFTAINSAGSTVYFSGATNVVTLNTTSAIGNTTIGSTAGNATITGTLNTGVGQNTLHALTTGSRNTALGVGSLDTDTTGQENVGLGYSSLTNITTGSNNTGVGTSSLATITTGSNNISVGNLAGSSLTVANSSNILLGNTGTVGDNNAIRIGTQGAGSGQQNTAYMAGIIGVTTANSEMVTINSVTGQLGVTTIPTGTGGVKVTTYTANDTWTKDINSKYIIVYGWNGGGGGGSGARYTGGTNKATGGGGGAGGGGFYYEGAAVFFPASGSVVIGAGGAGGAAQTVDFNTGNNGVSGGVSSFCNIAQNIFIDTTVASLGSGGQGGHTDPGPAAFGGDPQVAGAQFSLTARPDTGGGLGAISAATNPTAIAYGSVNAAGAFSARCFGISGLGGGGGSGRDSLSAQQAANGQSATNYNGGVTIITGGAGGIEGGTINGAPGNNYTMTSGFIIGGSGGGGGGGQFAGGSAGTGGAGGIPAGGGGGGGGSANGTNSGAGGAGSRGEIWVVEFLSS